MSCKAGNKKHKERCQKYKQEGRRERNRILKQERIKNRLQKFKEKMERRAAAGKTYKYDKKRTEQKRKDGICINTISKKTFYQKWESAMQKCQNEVNKENQIRKALAEKKDR